MRRRRLLSPYQCDGLRLSEVARAHVNEVRPARQALGAESDALAFPGGRDAVVKRLDALAEGVVQGDRFTTVPTGGGRFPSVRR